MRFSMGGPDDRGGGRGHALSFDDQCDEGLKRERIPKKFDDEVYEKDYQPENTKQKKKTDQGLHELT